MEVEKSEVKEVKYNLEALTKQHRFVSVETLPPRITVITGFIQSLEFLKKQSNFPGMEKVWKLDIKSGQL